MLSFAPLNATKETEMSEPPQVDYQTQPSRYQHWKLSFDGSRAKFKYRKSNTNRRRWRQTRLTK